MVRTETVQPDGGEMMHQRLRFGLSGRVVAVGVAACVSGTGIVSPGAASAGGPHSSTHGAGTNKPRNNDNVPQYKYRCISEDRFKVTQASIKMWSRGDRIKGFHFKYRFVAAGTAGQPQWWSNWSETVKKSFSSNQVKSIWMTAPRLGQSFSTASSWDLEVKLKYPRSKRPAKRYKYRVSATLPDCGGLPGNRFDA